MLFCIRRIPIETWRTSFCFFGRNGAGKRLTIYTNKRTVNHAFAWQRAPRDISQFTIPRSYGGDIIDHRSCSGALELLYGKGFAVNPLTSTNVSVRGVLRVDGFTSADVASISCAFDTGCGSLRRLHTWSCNSKQADTAQPRNTKRIEHSGKISKIKAAANNPKRRRFERNKALKDEAEGDKSRMARKKTNVSVDKLWETTKHTGNYAEAARIVDGLLDNRELRSKDGVVAINIYKLSRQPDKCVQTLEYIHRKGGRLLAHHYGACIAAFNASGNYSKAETLYEDMQTRNVRPNVVVCNTMIQVHLNSANLKKAMSLFRDMPGLGITRTVYTYSILISAFNRINQWGRALELYEQMVHERVERNTHTCSAAITACEKGKQWEKALEILSEMDEQGFERDTVTYSSAISACGAGQQLDKAIALFSEMEANGIERNTITYNSMITACERMGDWSRALEYLKEMQRTGVIANTITYNTAISACGAGHRLDKAIAVFQEMEANGIERDTITYNSMIAACEEVGDWRKALKYLQKMQNADVTADTITYNTAISACGEGELLDKAIYLMEEMVLKGIARDVITYINMLSACEKVGNWNKAVEYFTEMSTNGIERNAYTYNSVISACAEKGEWRTAIDLFNEMGRKNFEIDTITYSAAIRACGRGNKLEKAMGLFNEMDSRGVTRNSHVYAAAMSACEGTGQYEKAVALFDEMDAAEVDKTIQCYRTVIQALGGIDGEHPRIDSLYEHMTVRFELHRDNWSAFASGGRLDLHDHSKRMAQAAIRRLLRLLLAQHRDPTRSPTLKIDSIIVGKGNNSSEGVVLLDTVQAQLHGLFPPIASYTLTKNVGLLVLHQNDLVQWLEFNTQTVRKL